MIWTILNRIAAVVVLAGCALFLLAPFLIPKLDSHYREIPR